MNPYLSIRSGWLLNIYIYSIKKAGLLKKMYSRIRLKKWKSEDLPNVSTISPLKTMINKIARRLKTVIKRNVLKIAGDFSSLFLKVLLLLYNGRNDCIRPFIQNEHMRAAKNIKNSYSPIDSVVSLLFAITMLIRRRVPYLSIWKIWSPEILSLYFFRNNLVQCG